MRKFIVLMATILSIMGLSQPVQAQISPYNVPLGVNNGPYRYAESFNDTIIGAANGSEAVDVDFVFKDGKEVADLVIIEWVGAVNELHAQFWPSFDADTSSYYAPSSVFYIEEGNAIPFPLMDVDKCTLTLRADADTGYVRIIYFAR
jgi:hypothetical protein